MLCAAIKLSAFSQAICGSILLAQEPAWIARYRGTGGSDSPSGVAMDGTGAAIVTGTSRGDFLTVKYRATGEVQWAVRFGDANGWSEYVGAVAVDSAGNVFIAGSSWREGTSIDYTTIKYDGSGNQEWIAYFDGPAHDVDRPFALAVDDAGNVYVTGYQWGLGSRYDYATVKYDSSGLEQWVARLVGPGDADEWPHALAVDNVGNVYVTGISENERHRYDCATVKYDAFGVEQWVARYNGPADGIDYGTALVVDGLGNVYVTGSSWGGQFDDDFFTAKYDSGGGEEWVTRYDGAFGSADYPVAIAIDSVGSLFVTGGEQTSEVTGTITTIKFDPFGVEQWVARSLGPQNDVSSWPYALGLDSAGNVYIAGGWSVSDQESQIATIKYNPAGQEEWVRLFGAGIEGADYPRAIDVSPAGDVVVTGESWDPMTGMDYATLMYDAQGTQRWSARYVGPPFGSDSAYGLAADAAGNVYVTGGSESALHEIESATVKYDASGAEQWVARFDASTNGGTEGHDVAVDEAGNVYVAATAWDSGHASDFAVIKYDSYGVQQWAARYDGPERAEDDVADIAVDLAGNVYVTGRSRSYTTRFDYLTIKYDSSGARQWVARYDGSAHSDDEAVALAIDNSGNAYVCGGSTSAEMGTSVVTIKYDEHGAEQWAIRFGETARAVALTVDAAGYVYVAGSRGGWPPGGYVTSKYDSGGREQWVARFNGLNGGGGEATAMALDGSGNVYVTGTSYGGGTNADYATVKYDPNGIQQWVARYNSPNNYIDEAVGLAVDPLGVAYVTGRTRPDNSSWAYATVKYDPDGVERWASYYTGPGYGDEWVAGVVVDGAGNAYVTGASAENDEYMNDYATLKFARSSGDPDGDGDIDLNDFARFVGCMSGPAPSPGSVDASCLESLDFDTDTNLDLRDYSAFARFFAVP